MAQITIDIPEISFKDFSKKKWERVAREAALEAVKEKLEKLKKIERIKEIAAKSKATEKDVQELTDEINDAVAKHYSQY